MIFRSPYPDVAIPDVPLTPFVLRHAERLANKPALIDGASGRTLTYGQLADGVRRVAVGLARRGFRKGDVFATVCPNVPEFAARLLRRRLARRRDDDAQSALHRRGDAPPTRRCRSALRPHRAGAARPRCGKRSPGRGSRRSSSSARPTARRRSRRSSQHDEPLPPVAIDPAEDVVVLPYSSGTTGRPKGRDADPPQPDRGRADPAADAPGAGRRHGRRRRSPSSTSPASAI